MYAMIAMAALAAYQANEAQKQQNEQAKNDQESAALRQRQMNSQTEYQQQQTQEKVSRQLTARQRQADVQQSDLEAARVETGLSGISNLREQADIDIQKHFDFDTIKDAGGDKQYDIAMQSQRTQYETENIIAKAESQKVSGLESVLGIGTAAVGGAVQGHNLDSAVGWGDWGSGTTQKTPKPKNTKEEKKIDK